MSPGDDRVSLVIHWASATMENEIGSVYCSNGPASGGKYLPCPIGALVTHFNRNEGNAFPVAVSSRVTGPVIAECGGWFVTFPEGVPKTIRFTDMQIDHDTLLHVAIPYPSGTIFNIYAQAAPWCVTPSGVQYSWYPICQHAYRSVSSIDAVRSSWGDTYFYDSSTQLLHIRIISLDSFSYDFATNGTYQQNLIWNENSTYSTYFSRGGLNLLVTGSTFQAVVITATNCGANCETVSGASVPGVNGSAIYTGPPQTPSNYTFFSTSPSPTAQLGVILACLLLFLKR